MNNQQHKLECNVQLGQLLSIHLVNIMLEIFTLGLYSFWGKTKFRKAIINSCQFDNNKFEYTGTGYELFIGFIRTIPLMIIVYSAYFIIIAIGNQIISGVVTVLMVLIFIFFIGYSQYSATRYILTRTTFMGIKCGLDGSSFKFGCIYTIYSILDLLSLYVLNPYITLYLNSLIKNNIYFGTQKVNFTIHVSKKLFYANCLSIISLILLMLSVINMPMLIIFFIITFIIFRYKYTSELYENLAKNTKLMNLRFNFTPTAGSLFSLGAGNLAITILTLGLCKPWVILRRVRYFTSRFTVTGTVDLQKIKQLQLKSPKFGEGLAESMDVETGFGY